MYDMFGLFGNTPAKDEKTNIQDCPRYQQGQTELKVLLANQIYNRLDTDIVAVYDNVTSLAHILKESGEKEYIYRNIKFTIDFLGCINVELLD